MANARCPLCGSEKCKLSTNSDFNVALKCESYRTVVRFSSYFFGNCSEFLHERAFNLVCERIIRQPQAPDNNYWVFYYDENSDASSYTVHDVNLADYMREYPQTVSEIIDRVMLNFSHSYPSYGERFELPHDKIRLCYPPKYSYEIAEGVLKMLSEMGYLSYGGHGDYSISAEGWRKIESLQKQQNEVMQGFVAMQFGAETVVIREGFRQAIAAAGYSMRAIDEKEHNNQIVPEIFYEIGRSKFVVVDVTYPNYGAYYEAGYAYGLGKEVIVCCSKEAFDNKDGKYERPHFDISQKSMVIWDDIDDLKKKLKRRIEATVI